MISQCKTALYVLNSTKTLGALFSYKDDYCSAGPVVSLKLPPGRLCIPVEPASGGITISWQVDAVIADRTTAEQHATTLRILRFLATEKDFGEIIQISLPASAGGGIELHIPRIGSVDWELVKEEVAVSCWFPVPDYGYGSRVDYRVPVLGAVLHGPA